MVKMNFLGQTTRSDILYTVHQVTNTPILDLNMVSGTRNLQQLILAMANLRVVKLCFMLCALLNESPSCSCRLHFP
ncbi:hypothetical protein ACHAW6_007613 [Cyclotella cf. meneghiniana]